MVSRKQAMVRKELAAMLLYECACYDGLREERAALIAGSFLPVAIRLKALRMLRFEQCALAAFNDADPAARSACDRA